MKKKAAVFAAGICTAAMVLGGCSGARKAETGSKEDSGEPRGQILPEESELEDITAEEVTEPFRIWGEITDIGEDSITVDNQSWFSSPGEMILHIDPESTRILDASTGLPVGMGDIVGKRFEAYPGPAMTLSVQPQTTPELILVNLQEDADAPLYVTAQGPVRENEGKSELATAEGAVYVLADGAEITPYLTKNIVTAGDIEEGSRCLIWRDGEGTVQRLLLFGPGQEDAEE